MPTCRRTHTTRRDGCRLRCFAAYDADQGINKRDEKRCCGIIEAREAPTVIGQPTETLRQKRTGLGFAPRPLQNGQHVQLQGKMIGPRPIGGRKGKAHAFDELFHITSRLGAIACTARGVGRGVGAIQRFDPAVPTREALP